MSAKLLKKNMEVLASILAFPMFARSMYESTGLVSGRYCFGNFLLRYSNIRTGGMRMSI